MRLSLTKRLLQYSFLILISPVFPVFGVSRHSNSEVHRRATTCNGHAELCERSFGSVSFVGAHDSYAIGNSQNERKPESIQVGNSLSANRMSFCLSLLSLVAANQDQDGLSFFCVCQHGNLIVPVMTQLNDGIRMLQMQAHNNTGTIELCHTDCVSTIAIFKWIVAVPIPTIETLRWWDASRLSG